jgi:hypothetical protein
MLGLPSYEVRYESLQNPSPLHALLGDAAYPNGVRGLGKRWLRRRDLSPRHKDYDPFVRAGFESCG